MTIMRYIIWIVLVIVWFAVLSLCQYPLRKKQLPVLDIILIPVKLFIGVFLAYEVIVVESRFVYRFGLPLAALHVVFFGNPIGDILTLPAVIKKHKKSPEIQTFVSFLCTTAFLIFGTICMQTVRANRFTVTSDKLSHSYRFAFVSDLHVGSAQSFRTTESTIRRLEEEDPDFIIFGGDIVDEYTTKDEMERTFSLIGELDPPVYFIYGNHDVQPSHDKVGGRNFTPEELEKAILDNGIIILRDEWTRFSDDLVIFGREIYSSDTRKPMEQTEPRPEDAFVLFVNHSPYEYQDTIDSNADFLISGHSHAGQFFPMKRIYELAGFESYGFYHHGNTDVYISTGASGWCVPFRTESTCHYEVVTLEPVSAE